MSSGNDVQHPNITSSQTNEQSVNEQSQDENVCRICRGPAETDNPLFHPCKCSGSIRYVHDQCLSKWIEQSRNT